MNLPSFPNRQEYWLRRLEGVQEKSYLPYDLQQTKKISTDGETIYKEMEEGLEVELNMAAKQGETTLFSLLIASFYLHLYFSSGEEDLVIGVPVLGREHADFMDIVGMFVNTLPVRTTINGQMKLADFIAMVSRQIWSDLKNQSYPYDKIVEMRRKRGEHTNLFSIMFEYENESMSLYDRTENKGMGFILPLENSKYDLNVSVCKKNGKLYTKLDYKKELYSSARMSLFFNQYYRLLKEFNWEKWRDRTIDEIKELLR
jgi:non-ribosomal peptide synthetase component F